MILDFSVENFLSFNTEQTLSLEASADTTSDAMLVNEVIHPKTGNKSRLLRMTAIYGPNASGKSNLLSALTEIWEKLYYPKVSKDEPVSFRPFALRAGDDTSLSISFFIEGIRYCYRLRYNARQIEYETLEFNPNGVMSSFYERKHNHESGLPEITFGKNTRLDGKTSATIIANTLPNHSVLSTFNKIAVDAPVFAKAIDYIKRTWIERPKQSDIKEMLTESLRDIRRKDFMLQAIRKADFNITDVVSRRRKQDDTVIEFVHDYLSGTFILPLDAESAGTISFIENIDTLFDIMKESRCLMIDELDRSLHHDLIVYLIQTFLTNQSEAQFLFTTHDQLILNEDFMRRDMVWFTEKRERDASTEIFSADDFNLHKNASILNAYRLGRLGARPQVGSPFISASK